MDGANFSLLDIGMQQLISNINDGASNDPNSLADQQSHGLLEAVPPGGPGGRKRLGAERRPLVSMFQSKL